MWSAHTIWELNKCSIIFGWYTHTHTNTLIINTWFDFWLLVSIRIVCHFIECHALVEYLYRHWRWAKPFVVCCNTHLYICIVLCVCTVFLLHAMNIMSSSNSFYRNDKILWRINCEQKRNSDTVHVCLIQITQTFWWKTLVQQSHFFHKHSLIHKIPTFTHFDWSREITLTFHIIWNNAHNFGDFFYDR